MPFDRPRSDAQPGGDVLDRVARGDREHDAHLDRSQLGDGQLAPLLIGRTMRAAADVSLTRLVDARWRCENAEA
jgi:hypothetical protein